MFHVAFPRGQGPAFADLPPTLQPCAVTASAPHADRVRTLTLSGLIYLLLGSSAFAIASYVPPTVLVPNGPTRTERIIEFGGPPLPPVIELRTKPSGGSGGENPSPVQEQVRGIPAVDDPTEPPNGLSNRDRHDEIPGVGPSRPGTDAPPGTGTTGPAVTSSVQEVSVTGLAVLLQVDPAYPEFARKARIQGPVVLKMTVDERGQPTQVQVLEGHSVFHEAAMAAARQWRFEPARVDGRPVAASFRLTVRFTLK